MNTTAYVVGCLVPDHDSESGLKIVGLDVFSESEPSVSNHNRKTFVFAQASGKDFEAAVTAVLKLVQDYYPWALPAFNGRTRPDNWPRRSS